MSERVLYPDEEQRRRIMDFIMAAGQTLLENGAEVFRVEQTMEGVPCLYSDQRYLCQRRHG